MAPKKRVNKKKEIISLVTPELINCKASVGQFRYSDIELHFNQSKEAFAFQYEFKVLALQYAKDDNQKFKLLNFMKLKEKSAEEKTFIGYKPKKNDTLIMKNDLFLIRADTDRMVFSTKSNPDYWNLSIHVTVTIEFGYHVYSPVRKYIPAKVTLQLHV